MGLTGWNILMKFGQVGSTKSSPSSPIPRTVRNIPEQQAVKSYKERVKMK